MGIVGWKDQVEGKVSGHGHDLTLVPQTGRWHDG